MENTYRVYYSEDYLEHHGILGQKWGIRRYQNEDGSLTAAGRKRYLNDEGNLNEKGQKKVYDSLNKSGSFRGFTDVQKYIKTTELYPKLQDEFKQTKAYKTAKELTDEFSDKEKIKKEYDKEAVKIRNDLKSGKLSPNSIDTVEEYSGYLVDNRIIDSIAKKNGYSSADEYRNDFTSEMDNVAEKFTKYLIGDREFPDKRTKKTIRYAVSESFLNDFENERKKESMSHSAINYPKYLIHYSEDYLEHHGILGQKWGIRRYQNEDGSLTEAGQKRYNSGKNIKGFDKEAYSKSIAKSKSKDEINKLVDDSDLVGRDIEVQEILGDKKFREDFMKEFLDENGDKVRETVSYMKDRLGDVPDYAALRDGWHYELELENNVNKFLDVESGYSRSKMEDDFLNLAKEYSDYDTIWDEYNNKLQSYFDKAYSKEMFEIDEKVFNEWAKENMNHSAIESPKYLIHYSEDYLEHHGILGMKWGVRRYQNKDGSLTSLGQKHRAQREGRTSKYEERTAKATARKASAEARITEAKAAIAEAKAAKVKKQQDIKKVSTTKTVRVKDLSNEELKARTERLKLEKSFIDAQVARYPVQPKTKSYMTKLLEKAGTGALSAVSGAIQEVGKAYIKEILADALDVDMSNNNNNNNNNNSNKKK